MIGPPVMIKSQILSGKRGKAGLIRPADDLEQALSISKRLLGSKVGYGYVQGLLFEKKIAFEDEFYLGVTADPSKRQPVILFSGYGGIDVEELSQTERSLHKKYVDILKGIEKADISRFIKGFLCRSEEDIDALSSLIVKLYNLYRDVDCRLVEINPLVSTSEGFFAVDARIDIDDDAITRQQGLGIHAVEETGDRPPTLLEIAAGKIDEGDHRGSAHFVQTDPYMEIAQKRNLIPIGFDCVGTGTSLTALDELVDLGYFPVNFADTSGNPTGSKMYRITKIILSQPGIRGYLFISCVSSQQLDNTARGIIKALKELYSETGGRPNIPMVVCFRGAWDDVAIKLFEDHGISGSDWVEVLGRDNTEQEAVQVFDAVYKKWVLSREEDCVGRKDSRI
jgi:succinyl-CoA synthetase beta subunit